MSMQRQRLGLAVGVAILLLVIVLGVWVARRASRTLMLQPPATPTARVLPTATASATVTPLRPPPGYRLAGVALGEPESFVVIEAPNGTTTLYRLNADIPGLGTLVHVEAERVVLRGAAGEFELWLAPAATPTVVRKTPTRKPSPRPSPGGTVAAPRPSIAPGRPVS